MIANVENSAAGFGVTGDIADAILGYGVDVMTTGNHVWDKKEVLDYIPRQPKLLRPANFPPARPGRGSYIGRTRTGEPVGVLNLMGRIFMTPLDDPFALALSEVENLRAKARVVFVDFHAEATSEKVAMGWHLDGRVDGGRRHPHPRADRRRAAAAEGHGLHHRRRHDRAARLDHRRHRRRRARTVRDGMPSKFEAAAGGARLNAVIVTADPRTGKATAIERVNLSAADVEALAESQAATARP